MCIRARPDALLWSCNREERRGRASLSPHKAELSHLGYERPIRRLASPVAWMERRDLYDPWGDSTPPEQIEQPEMPPETRLG
jgi:hypothetical protein